MLLVKQGSYESHWNDKCDEVALFLKRDENTTCEISGLPIEDHVVTVRITNNFVPDAVTGTKEDIVALTKFHMKGKYQPPAPNRMSDESFLWHIARQDKGYYDKFKDKPEFTTTGWKVHCDRCGDSARDFFCLDLAIVDAKKPACKHDVRQRIHRIVTHHVMLPESSTTVDDTVFATIQKFAGTERRMYSVKVKDRVKHAGWNIEGEVISIIEDGDVTKIRVLWDDVYYGITNAGVFASNVVTLDDKPLAQAV